MIIFVYYAFRALNSSLARDKLWLCIICVLLNICPVSFRMVICINIFEEHPHIYKYTNLYTLYIYTFFFFAFQIVDMENNSQLSSEGSQLNEM